MKAILCLDTTITRQDMVTHVDQAPETMPGLHGNVDGALFYFVQASCGSLGCCPDYIEATELTCGVCSI